MNYLEYWIRDLFSRESLRLKKAVKVEGIRNQHLGPRWQYAKVQISVEPHSGFAVDIQINEKLLEELQKDNWVDWTILGLLDVLMTATPKPVRDIRVILIDAKYDEVNSSRMAFRHAGRDAGRKILDSVENE